MANGGFLEKSDKDLGSNIYAAHVVLYTKATRDAAEKRVRIAKRAMWQIKKHQLLNLPNDVKLRLAHIKSARRFGTYYHWSRLAEVEVRSKTDESFIESLCHEMTHSDQYHHGRLIGGISNSFKKWHGAVYSTATDHASYLALPWEVEARETAATLTGVLINDFRILNDL